MIQKFTFSLLTTLFTALTASSQITLNTAAANNGSGGIFLRLTTNSSPVRIQQFNTYFSSTSGTAVSVEVYSRSGDYTAYTTANTGWILLGTISGTSAGTAALATLDVNNLNVAIPPATVTSFYLQGINSNSGIRYTGTTAAPPTTTWTDTNLELYSTVARTGTISFGGTSNSPRTFAGSVVYVIGGLPVKWLNVSGKEANGQAQLSWTVEESNVSSYAVERQTKTGFTTIETIRSKGDGKNIYSFTDSKAFEDKASVAYFRILQKDKDGRNSYSPVVMVKNGAVQNEISVYPNPFISSFQVYSATPQLATVSLLSGQVLSTLQLSAGNNAIDAQQWLPGIYLLKPANRQSVKIIKE